MKAIKTTTALLLCATICLTACAPKTPGRTVPTNDSTGGSSPDTLRQSAAVQQQSPALQNTTVKPLITASASDSTGGSSPDTLYRKQRQATATKQSTTLDKPGIRPLATATSSDSTGGSSPDTLRRKRN